MPYPTDDEKTNAYAGCALMAGCILLFLFTILILVFSILSAFE
jgi:hypothetical protein